MKTKKTDSRTETLGERMEGDNSDNPEHFFARCAAQPGGERVMDGGAG